MWLRNPLHKKYNNHRHISFSNPMSLPRAFVKNTFVARERSVLSNTTPELLQKLGFIKQSASGVFHWLPYGTRLLQKLTNVIRNRMEEVGFAELELSLLLSPGLWKKTHRWANTELFKLKDSRGLELCLVPTCEEEIVDLVNGSVQSYKQLPVLLYQVTRKYRDERRPRGGLLRAREFLMKDAYLFDETKSRALMTFDAVNKAYGKIVEDLKIPAVAAKADLGSIGGDTSVEWHYLHESGEDTVVVCEGCGAAGNVEKAVLYPPDDAEPAKEARVRYYTSQDKSTLVCVYYPKDRVLEPRMVKSAVDADVESCGSNEEVLYSFLKATADSVVQNVVRLIDPRVSSSTLLPDFPEQVRFQRNSFTTFNDILVVRAVDGEICGECNEHKLKSHKAIEIAHAFYLGTRYSKPLEATYMDIKGDSHYFEMGCYGIGVLRLLASVAEVLRDDKGLVFPAKIAPFSASIVVGRDIMMGEDAPEVQNLVADLKKRGIDVRVDSRTELSLPERIHASHSLGIPLAIVFGKSFPEVEIEVRGRPFESQKWVEEYEKGGWRMEVDRRGNEKHYVGWEKAGGVVETLLEDL